MEITTEEANQAVKAALPRGRPRIPASEKKICVSTTIDAATYEAIQQSGMVLNQLIYDGIEHRQKCHQRDQRLLEMMDTIKMQEAAIDKLNLMIAQNGSAI